MKISSRQMPKQITYEEALSRTTRYCSLAEKCEQDVRKKLTAWQLSIENTEKIIAYLKEEKYLNEMRFAGFFVQDKHRFAKWGKSKIIFALKNKGISTGAIEVAIKNIDVENYSGQLKTLLASKFKSIKYKDTCDAKAKLYRFGISKGFENDLVLKAIDEILSNK
ncbi:MAG: RecX family transcriptional regulator [Prevotellaceae bacterium]|jgi:regulatory protein|nr:RecX family transcriptional regulator [Prevotellaceae bacterium]